MVPAIQLSDGAEFRLIQPDYTNITPDVLARALSRTPRFSTHWKAHIPWYSVAQHSINVSRNFRDDKQMALAGLLHDAHEPFWGFGDICRPAKYALSGAAREELRRLQLRHQWAVFAAYNCNVDPENLRLRHADDTELARERRDLMSPSSVYWGDLPEPDAWRVVPWRPAEAAEKYQRALEELLEEI